MNLNKFTIKSQEALQKASNIADAKQNQAVEPVHLLKAILSVDENVAPYLLMKLNVNIDQLKSQLDKLIDGLPKVTGGQLYLSSNSNTALRKAQEFASETKDEFTSIEQLLLAILLLNDPTSHLMQSNRI